MKDEINLLIQANQARVDHRYQDAIDYYITYLGTCNNADAMRVLALTYVQLDFEQPGGDVNQCLQALEWINKAIEQDPRRAEFYVTRGFILSYVLSAPDCLGAARDYRVALQLNPERASAYLGLAGLEGVPEQVVSLSEAIESVQKASQIQAEDPFPFLRLGSLYIKAGQENQAVDAFTRALLQSQPLSSKRVREVTQHLVDTQQSSK